ELTVDDIRLLVELFYLPYEHGANAQQMFCDFYWLRYNYSRHGKLDEWRCRASSFHDRVKSINRLVQRLTTIHNRCLLYDIYSYITDISSTISLCSRYLYWLDNEEKRSKVFLSGDVEPGSKRGGLVGEYLNILPRGDFQSILHPDVDCSSDIFCIRPMITNDQSCMYELCRRICNEDEIDDQLKGNSNVIGDKMIGGYLFSLSNHFRLCYCVENSKDDFCAFVLTMIESEKYDKFIESTWISQLHQKYSTIDQNIFESTEYPQWIYDQYPVRIQLFVDFTILTHQTYFLGNKLMKIISDQLIQQGYRSCHALVDERNCLLYQYYLRLGFLPISTIEQDHHVILVAKQF
ncbi:unnamed protein product, partial [Adineta ricciae]